MPHVYPTLTVKPDTEGWTEGPVGDPTIRTDFENGISQTRARFTAVGRRWQFRYSDLPANDKEALAAFQREVNFGAATFTWLNPTNDVIYTVRFAKSMDFALEPTQFNLWTTSVDLIEAYPQSGEGGDDDPGDYDGGNAGGCIVGEIIGNSVGMSCSLPGVDLTNRMVSIIFYDPALIPYNPTGVPYVYTWTDTGDGVTDSYPGSIPLGRGVFSNSGSSITINAGGYATSTGALISGEVFSPMAAILWYGPKLR